MTGFLERISRRAAGQTGAVNAVTLSLRQRSRFEPPSSGRDAGIAEEISTEAANVQDAPPREDGLPEVKASPTVEIGPVPAPAAEPSAPSREVKSDTSREPQEPPALPRADNGEAPVIAHIYEEYPDSRDRDTATVEKSDHSPAEPQPPRAFIWSRDAEADTRMPYTERNRAEEPDTSAQDNANNPAIPAYEISAQADRPHPGESNRFRTTEQVPGDTTERFRAIDDTDRVPATESSEESGRTIADAHTEHGFLLQREPPEEPAGKMVEPPPSLSIGQVTVEFQAPPQPQRPSGPRPVNRTRGFDAYSRARRGIPR